MSSTQSPIISVSQTKQASVKAVRRTSRFAHGDRLDEVLWSHVQLPFILHRAEHAEAMLVGRHVHVTVLKVKRTTLQT